MKNCQADKFSNHDRNPCQSSSSLSIRAIYPEKGAGVLGLIFRWVCATGNPSHKLLGNLSATFAIWGNLIKLQAT